MNILGMESWGQIIRKKNKCMTCEMEVYRHFKGGMYIKLFEAIDSETLEEVIVYASMQDGKIYTRNKKMFYENVHTSKFYGPRFYKIPKGE